MVSLDHRTPFGHFGIAEIKYFLDEVSLLPVLDGEGKLAARRVLNGGVPLLPLREEVGLPFDGHFEEQLLFETGPEAAAKVVKVVRD